jgi:hypothetical protein
METTTPTSKNIQDAILVFLKAGAQRADSALQARTYARLYQVVVNYFDVVPNQHAIERLDWRIIQLLFSYVFSQGATAWNRLGEELFDEMRHLDEPR